MPTTVTTGQTKITFDPKTGNLIVFNRQNIPIHIRFKGLYKSKEFQINIDDIEQSGGGLTLTGRSGRKRTLNSEQLSKLINFANDTNKTEEILFKSVETIGIFSVEVSVSVKKVKPGIMERIVKLNESDLTRIINRVLSEQEHENYMFFSNLEQIKRQCEMLLELDPHIIDEIIQNGHDWADDHVSEAKNNMDQVFDFMMNETKKMKSYIDYEMLDEGRKKSGTKLCARGKAAAKAKYKVYPSAYGNGYGVQVCKGDIAGLDGKKRCSPPYC